MLTDMVADIVADMEVDIVADIEVDKVANMAADKKLDMVADMEVDMVTKMVADNKKKSTFTVKMENLVRELITGGGYLGSNFFDPKLTRLAHLRHFASLRGNSPL